MSAGKENKPSWAEWFLQLISAQRAVNFSVIATFVGSILWIAWETYLRYETLPIAGYIDHLIPASDGRPAVFVRDWHLLNPGPGNLSGTLLEVDVADVFDTNTGSFDSGLVITNGPGISHTVERNGTGSRIRFSPPDEQLGCSQKLCCQFHIHQADWAAITAQVILPGNTTVEANRPFDDNALPSNNLTLPIIFSLIFGLLLLLSRLREKQFRDSISEKVRKEMEKQQPNIAAKASIDDQETLQQANLNQIPPYPPPSETRS